MADYAFLIINSPSFSRKTTRSPSVTLRAARIGLVSVIWYCLVTCTTSKIFSVMSYPLVLGELRESLLVLPSLSNRIRRSRIRWRRGTCEPWR